METGQQIGDKIISTFSHGKISDLDEIKKISTEGRNFLEVILEIDDITREGAGVLLPSDFFIELNARTVRKYLQPLKLRRFKSKKQAIAERITPYALIREAREKIIDEKYYGGINWRGISDRKNKTFLLYSWLEGCELHEIAKPLIKVRRYDVPDELRELNQEERKKISDEISKLTKKRIDIEHEIMQRGGVRTGAVPSRTERGKFYDDIRIDGLPVKFDGIKSDFHYATWFDISSRHNCKDKQMFIAYARPREELFCSHDIAFLIACHNQDNEYHRNPYLVFTPFPTPNPTLTDANKRYRKMVFKEVKGRRVPINKIDREGLLFCEIKATDIQLF